MGLFDWLRRKPPALHEPKEDSNALPDGWPNQPGWAALQTGELQVGDQRWLLHVADCGELFLPSGKLVACDPFAGMQKGGNPFVRVPPGRYPVRVTIADLSPARDRAHVREAYATLILSDEPEVTRRVLPLLAEGESPPEPVEGEFVGFGVDAGTACFVDDEALVRGMPDEREWHEGLFENPRPDSWFNQMDSAGHLEPGLANIRLPLGKEGENLILFHSGWGDGLFPVVGGYSAKGELVRVHIDFGVVR